MPCKLLLSCSLSALSSLVILLLLMPVSVCSQKGLSSKAKREVKKGLTLYAKASDNAERAAAATKVLLHGRRAVEHLSVFADSKRLSAAAAAIRFSAPKELGWDLLAKSAPTRGPFHPSYFVLGEVAVLQTETTLAGFRVLSTPDPDDGIAVIDYWTQSKVDRDLAQAGGQSGQRRVTGTAAAKPLKRNSGYNELDFEFNVGGIDIKIRFVGPTALRPYESPTVGWALSGQSEPKGLAGNTRSLHFQRQESEALLRLRNTLAEYLYRVLPGCTPLPLERDELQSFAQYQQVQVTLRLTRPEGRPVILVRLPEYKTSGFQAYHEDYIRNYCHELFATTPVEVLISGGAGSGLEGGMFWLKSAWRRPNKSLKHFLRQNFPTL